MAAVADILKLVSRATIRLAAQLFFLSDYGMTDTSITFLQRLQDSNDPESWDRLMSLYRPLLTTWLRKYDVQVSDSDDLIQEVLIAVVKDLPKFKHNGRTGAFRAWLRSIMVNRLRSFWKTRERQLRGQGGTDIQVRLAQLDDPTSEMSQHWNQQHDLHVAQQLLRQVESDFTVQTWAAFTRVAIDGQRADAVAAELGISTNAVFIAKSRVLSRLRREAAGLIDSNLGIPEK